MSVRTSILPGIGILTERGQHQSVLPGLGVMSDSMQLITLTQYRPSSDVSAGGWSPSAGAALYAVIDEVSFDDSDYIISGANPSGDIVEIKIVAQTPVAGTNHTVSYRIKADGGMQMVVQFRCGDSTLIKEWTHNPAPAVYTTYNQTLTTDETATISDYTDLRMRFIAG